MWLNKVLKRVEVRTIKIAIYFKTIIIRAINKFYYESFSLLEL